MLDKIVLTVCVLACAACFRQPENPPPKPQAVTADAVGYYCTMNLQEHKGPKAQLFLHSKPGQPVWFSTVNQLFGYVRHPGEPRDISAAYVNDMGAVSDWQNPDAGDAWVDAHAAHYVIDSPFMGGMGAPDALPFADPAKAKAFAARHGGRVVGFDEMPDQFIYR